MVIFGWFVEKHFAPTPAALYFGVAFFFFPSAHDFAKLALQTV